MKTEKVIMTGIIFGLVLSSILIFLDIGLYGGGISAILIGMTVGWLIENKPVKYTMISVSAYNLIIWTLIMLFDPDAKIVYQYKSVTTLFIGFIIIMIVFYSIIGSISALITYNLKRKKL